MEKAGIEIGIANSRFLFGIWTPQQIVNKISALESDPAVVTAHLYPAAYHTRCCGVPLPRNLSRIYRMIDLELVPVNLEVKP
jgi:hypothetical protein